MLDAKSDLDRRGIQSVEIGVRVISVLAAAGGPLTLKVLSAGAELPASNCYRYCVSFVRTGYLRQNIAVRTSVALGSTLTLLTSATGRVFHAFLPSRQTAAIAEREIMDGGDPATSAEQVRAVGMAQVSGEHIPGLSAIAAPILDVHGEAAAVLTLVAARGGGSSGGPPSSAQRSPQCLLSTWMAAARQCGDRLILISLQRS